MSDTSGYITVNKLDNRNAAHEHTTLQAVDHAVFFSTLDNPPAPNDKLRAAFERHNATIAKV
jgi:uncharacterized protein (DUF1778 family)